MSVFYWLCCALCTLMLSDVVRKYKQEMTLALS